jgi:homoprotocatechuate degradation regulator HpaR
MTKKPNEPVQQQAVRGRKQPGLKLVSRASLRDDRQSLPIALLRAREAVMQHFRSLHRKGKVTEQQWRVLRVLYLEGEMDAGKLANHSFLLAPSLSRILKDLESAEHIKRRASATDSRQSLISLSAKGATMISRAAPVLDRVHQEIMERFGIARMNKLLKLLIELEGALSKTKTGRPDSDESASDNSNEARCEPRGTKPR